jgi:hypothetical protein
LRRLTLQLDHPPRGGPDWDPGGLQIARALRRPLAGTPDAWCDWSPEGCGGTLIIKPQHRRSVRAVEVARAIERGLPGPWRHLAGAPQILDAATVRWPGPLALALLPVLSSPDFDVLEAPTRLRRTPASLASERVEVSLHVQPCPERAQRALERGAVDLTCPTAFDLAVRLAGHERYRPVELDLHLVLVALAEELAPVRHRRWLSQTVAAELAGHPVLRPVPMAGEAGPPRLDRPLTLAYGSYWPNERAVEALARLLPLEPVPQSLDTLRQASDVDLVLMLAVGEAADPRASWAWWLARRAPHRPDLLQAVLRGDLDPTGLEESLPVARLATFRSGYVAPAEAAPVPLWRTSYPVAALLESA